MRWGEGAGGNEGEEEFGEWGNDVAGGERVGRQR